MAAARQSSDGIMDGPVALPMLVFENLSEMSRGADTCHGIKNKLVEALAFVGLLRALLHNQ